MSDEAERLIVGHCLLRPDRIDGFIDRLKPSCFQNENVRAVWEVLVDTVLQGKAMMRASVIYSLEGIVREPGAFISALEHEADRAKDANLDILANLLVDRFLRNEVAKLSEPFAKALSDHKRNATEVVSEQIGKLEALQMMASSDEVSPFIKTGSLFIEEMTRRHKEGIRPGVPLPLPELGEVLSEDEMEPGNLYGLLSASGEGKTSLTMQMVLCALKAGHPVCVFSYDQTRTQCIQQMIAQEYGISVARQKKQDLSDAEWEEVFKFGRFLDSCDFSIASMQRETAQQLVAISRRFRKSLGAGKKAAFFVFDHIGRIQIPESRKGVDAGTRAGEIAGALKAFMRESESVGLVLNQRNSFGMRRPNPRPTDADIFGGEGAKADYDAILYLYRKEVYRKKRMDTAANQKEREQITALFGTADSVEGKAEIGAIKARWGDPSIRKSITFVARFTRYETMKVDNDQMALLA